MAVSLAIQLIRTVFPGSFSSIDQKNGLCNLFSRVDRNTTHYEIADILRSGWKLDSHITFEFIFYIRDPLRGLGLKDQFYHALRWLNVWHPVLLRRNLPRIYTTGTFKDLYYLLELLDSDLWNFALTEIAFCVRNIESLNRKTRISVAKYMPTEKRFGSKEYIRSQDHFRRYIKLLGCHNAADYRKNVLRPIRERYNAYIVERDMSVGRWKDIEMKCMGATAFRKYRNAFQRRNMSWKISTKMMKKSQYRNRSPNIENFLERHSDPKNRLKGMKN